MKLSINWLKDYIDPKLSTDELIHRLTMAGLEIEHVETIGSDTVLEIEITPNRPDCLNTLGLAREIGAITEKEVKYPKINTYKSLESSVAVSIENTDDCSRYIATLIKGVKITEASQNIKERVEALGIRPINNAVDITNFVLMEIGQPLHAFDYDKLAGGKIIVRRAKAGEKIVTLDGIERKLDPSILVIADAQKPVAIAGIMGGRDTEITSSTKNILLESAHFDMGLIRRSCRTLGLRSDSSYRFERNVAFEGVLTGAIRASDLLLEATGGTFAGRLEVGTNTAVKATEVSVKLADISSLLGAPVTLAQATASLTRLGFEVSANGETLSVVVPSNRLDVKQDVDLIEEIARMIGFDNLPSKLPLIKAVNITVNTRPRETKKQVRGILTACGIDEIVTYSMTNTKALAKSGLGSLISVRVFNPLNQDQELMRPSLLPLFLQCAMTNINRGQKDIRFFEIGKRYFAEGERNTVGILLTGRRHFDWRASKKETVDMFDLKGALGRLFEGLNANVTFEASSHEAFDEGCSSVIRLKDKELGRAGKLSSQVLSQWDIKNQDIYFAEIDLESLTEIPKAVIKYQPISQFPSITRDVSLAVKKDVTYANVESICFAQGGEVLKSVVFIEQYVGDKVAAGHKALVFSCQYQSNDRTLREDEVSVAHERVVNSLIEKLGATRR